MNIANRRPVPIRWARYVLLGATALTLAACSSTPTAGPPASPNPITPSLDVSSYEFPDGSSKTVMTRTDANTWASGTITITVFYFDGRQLGSLMQSLYSVRGGYSILTTATSPTDDPNAPGTSTTVVVTNPDGSRTITTTIRDKVGTTSTPITVAATRNNLVEGR
jgi:hypothetical protein